MSVAVKDPFHVEHSSDTCGMAGTLQYTSVTWKIVDFSLRARKADEKLKSSEFSCADAIWELFVYPNGGRKNKSVGKIGLYLRKVYSLRQEHTASVIFSILNDEGNCKSYETRRTFVNGDEGWGFPYALCRELAMRKNSGFTPGDILTVMCDITILETNDPEVSSAGTNEAVKDAKKQPLRLDCDSNTLSSDFESLCNNPRFSDVVLKLGHVEFPAHKAVLGARSRVFAAMFEHEMVENRLDAVDLVEMEVATVQDMLRHIYCGKVRELSPEEALNLYAAADRYDLQKLKTFCREVISYDVSVSNVCDIAVVADLHNDEILISVLKPFLSKNGKEIIKTEQWKAMIKNKPALCAKMFEWAFTE